MTVDAKLSAPVSLPPLPAEVLAVDAACRRLTTPLGDGELVWRSAGQGEPLVLLHGGYGSWMHWLRNILPLSQDMQVLAADMPGYNESGDGADLTDPTVIAGELLDSLSILLGENTPFHLTAFSFGCAVSGQIVRAAPERVLSFTMIAAAGTGLTRASRAELVRWRGLSDETAIRQAHATNLAIHMIADPARIDETAIAIQRQSTLRARVRSPEISRRPSLFPALERTRMPLAGIWGGADATAKGYIHERRDFVRKLDPDAPFFEIEGAGHWAQYEAADAVNAAIRQSVARARSDAVRAAP